MALKLVNLLALLSVAALGVSFGPAPANAASLSIAGHHSHHKDHYVVAKKRRGASNKRCKQRPTSSLTSDASSTPAATPAAPSSSSSSSSSTPEATPTTTYAPPPPPSSTQHQASTTSSSAVTVATPPSGGNHDGKVGLAWPNGDWIPISPWISKHVKYIYTWSESIPKSATDAGLIGIPMLWGIDDKRIQAFTQRVKPGYANIVAGFNEPNEPGQSNMTPEQGADAWKKYIEPLRSQGYQTVCPTTSSNPNGMVWVDNFLKACNGGCTCDYMGVHYYDITVEGFENYITNWCTHYGKKVFVTEFACQNFNGGAQCSPDQVHDFWRRSISWMNQNECVMGYFGFGAMHGMDNVNPENRLMGDDGKPNWFGQAYVDGY